ncbi:hypothetical protein SEUCBS139899_008420 [Sporothrix eucalyptigena]
MEHLKSDEDGVVEFALFRWPFGHTIPCRADSASRVDGLLVQFFGFKIEAKDEAVHITVWSNMQRRKKFSLFSENRPLHLPAQKPDDIKLFAFNPKDFDKLLATLLSPLTEVFTGYGALKAFNTNVADYEDRLSRGGAKATAGYVDSVVLKTVEEVKVSKKAIEDNPRLELLTGPAVRLLVGWSSHEKRLKAMNSEGREFTPHLLYHDRLLTA